jgi:predicted membrane channel-forming protein YqfA (hemolysin III family)
MEGLWYCNGARNPLINLVIFSLLLSIVHATLVGVLAFSATELGATVGSYSGFCLYTTYTLSSLLFAKPFLRIFSSKFGVFLVLWGVLIYVGSFFFALRIPSLATILFLTGASIGGIGAGILWPSYGVYYR